MHLLVLAPNWMGILQALLLKLPSTKNARKYAVISQPTTVAAKKQGKIASSCLTRSIYHSEAITEKIEEFLQQDMGKVINEEII